MIRKLNKTICFAVMALALMLGFAFGHGTRAYAISGVAQIVETETVYETLDAAYGEVTEGQTIKLLDNIDLGETVFNTSKTYTLDLNGKTITGTGDPAVVNLSSGILTIKDSGEGGTIYNEYNTYWRDAVDVGRPISSVKPTLILKGGTLKSKKGQAIENSGTLTAEGGNIIGENYTALYNYNGTITIKDGTFIQGTPQAIDTSSGYEGKIYIQGGTLKSTAAGYAGAICLRRGTADISGGILEGPYGIDLTDTPTPSRATVTFTEGSKSVVTGTKYGTFEKDGGTVNINGGYFSDDIGNGDEYTLPEGKKLFKVGGEGTYKDYYTVKDIVAQIEGKGAYDSLAAAVTAAEDGDTITMQADHEETDTVTVDKKITLDLNGKTVSSTFAPETGKQLLRVTGDLTIEDSSESEGTPGTGKIEKMADDSHDLILVSGGKLTLNSGTIHGNHYVITVINESVNKIGEFQMNGGAIRTDGTVNTIGIAITGTAVIEGGSIESDQGYAVRLQTPSLSYEPTLTVTGGTISGEVGISSLGTNNHDKVTISGGSITGKGKDGAALKYTGCESATISGDAVLTATDDAKTLVHEQGTGTVNINGGYYSDDEGNGDDFVRPTCYFLRKVGGSGKYADYYKLTVEHTWDAGKVTKKATATTEGVKTYTCTVCQATRTEAIPKTALGKVKLTTTPNLKKKTVKATWKKVAGADSYTFAWRLKGGKWKTKKTTALTYTVKNIKRGKKYEFKVTATRKATATAAASTSTAVNRREMKTTGKCVAFTGKKSARVKWLKVSTAKGYVITYATNKSFKNAKSVTVKGKNKLSRTIKKLKSGKTYYFRVTHYTTSGGKKYTGVPSPVDKVKVK